jgi:hypothetical protein
LAGGRNSGITGILLQRGPKARSPLHEAYTLINVCNTHGNSLRTVRTVHMLVALAELSNLSRTLDHIPKYMPIIALLVAGLISSTPVKPFLGGFPSVSAFLQ